MINKIFRQLKEWNSDNKANKELSGYDVSAVLESMFLVLEKHGYIGFCSYCGEYKLEEQMTQFEEHDESPICLQCKRENK